MKFEQFDPDELGTLDDIWTGLMINDLEGIKSIQLTRDKK